MEQVPVNGLNVPADPHHAYGQHQQNGFHASTGNAGASGLCESGAKSTASSELRQSVTPSLCSLQASA